MADAPDYRDILTFDSNAVKESGKSISSSTYWKLFAIENYYRVVIHTILRGQHGEDWWSFVVSERWAERVQSLKESYISTAGHSPLGEHIIYHTTLWQLNEIVRIAADQFDPRIDDLDDLITKVEEILPPRNLVAHMNHIDREQKMKITFLYRFFKKLIKDLQEKHNLSLEIPM